MSSILLSANRVPLGPSNAHLQVVYNNAELEVQAGLTWQFMSRDHDDPLSTPHFGEANWYDSIAIDIGDRSAAQVWATLNAVYDAFVNQMEGSIPYLVVTQNSNTFINSLLSVIGVSAGSYVPLLSINPLTVTVIPDDGSSPYDLTYDGISAPGVGQNIFDSPSFALKLTLNGGTDNDIFVAGFGNDTLSGGDGNDKLDGGGGSDVLSGGNGEDQIHGGIGADTIDGGGGNDIIWSDEPDQTRSADVIDAGSGDDVIYFDELDTTDGGGGWDVAIYSSNLNTSSIDMDVIQNHLEVVVAGLGADTLSADGSTEVHLAGLDGNDRFHIVAGGGAPTIVWGGIGADTISIAATDPSNPDAHDPVGILVVNVENLTPETFVNFDLNMVNVGSGFDWSQIDVVVLNPESSDQLVIDGSEIGTFSDTIPVTYRDPSDDSTHHYGSVSYLATNDIGDWYTAGQHHAANYTVASSLLGGGVTSVFAPTAVAGFWDITVYDNGVPGDVYINSEDFRLEDYESDLSLSSASYTSGNYMLNETTITSYAWANYDVFGAPYTDGWSSNLPFAFGASSVSGIGPINDINDIGPWFVVGGFFGTGGLVSSNTYSVTMPDPQGGTDAGTGAIHLSSGSGVRIIVNFNVTSNVVVLNGGPINPNAPGVQVTLAALSHPLWAAAACGRRKPGGG